MRELLKKITHEFIWRKLRSSYRNLKRKFEALIFVPILIILAPFLHKLALNRVRKKTRIKIVFFLIHESVWKYDGVYKLMLQDDRFDPVIVVCPYIAYGEEVMLRDMNQAYNAFTNKGYNVIKSLNEETGIWIDVKKEIQPDVVFFTNPHKLTKDEYYINNYSKYLTCYVPYNFGNSHLYNMMYNQPFHNFLWKFFAETIIHKGYSEKFAFNKGRNVMVTGFPGTDIFLDKSYKPKKCWKQDNDELKRIIWAPHHTIDSDTTFLSYSSFLKYHDFIIRLAINYRGKIQFAFKPHPLLINKLYKEPGWGKERTDNYYRIWEKMDNGQLVIGDYVDLFLTSDAMMHDCGSFLIEYLLVNKPVLHLTRDENITQRMNDFGIQAYYQHYHAKDEDDIRYFIEAIINNQDEKKSGREEFINKYLLPPDSNSASVNIYTEVVNQIFKQPPAFCI